MVNSGASKPLGLILQNCGASFCATGVHVRHDAEGIQISQSSFLSLKTGILMDYLVHLALFNCHINSNPSSGGGIACVRVSGAGVVPRVDVCILIGNLLFPSVGGRGITGEFRDSVISSNIINGEANGQTGIIGIEMTGDAYANSITGNLIHGCASGAIHLGSLTQDNKGSGNVMRNNGSNITDAGTGNAVS